MGNEKPKKKCGADYLREKLAAALAENERLKEELASKTQIAEQVNSAKALLDWAKENEKELRQRLRDAEADYLKEYRELWHWLGPVRRFVWKLKHGQL